MLAQSIVQVDAFTNEPYHGNPAAVCVLTQAMTETWMQSVAAEMNLPETAFLLPRDDGYQLRWFTPVTEVDLCGHATLASAHVLWEDGHISPEAMARFHTRSGLLTATRKADWISLDFPTEPALACAPPPLLLEALSTEEPVWVGKNRVDYLIELPDEAAVRALEPDMAMLRRVDMRGLIVTAKASDPGVDFVSRFFAPGIGVDEDPVCGSAHCCLGPYWQSKLGKQELLAHQVSRRGGVLRVGVGTDRIVLSGQAITVMRGTLV